MKSLILDSATKTLYISLVDDGNILYEKYIEGRNDHAKNIVFVVDEALKSNNLSCDDLNRVIVGYGPGSYTGVRMAVTVAKMLAVFKHIDLYTISTLKLMASSKLGIAASMIDARRGNAFGGVFDMDNDKEILKEGMYSYEEIKGVSHDFEVTEDNFKVDVNYVINHANKVLEPHLLVPNYLRETEAERNLK